MEIVIKRILCFAYAYWIFIELVLCAQIIFAPWSLPDVITENAVVAYVATAESVFLFFLILTARYRAFLVMWVCDFIFRHFFFRMGDWTWVTGVFYLAPMGLVCVLAVLSARRGRVPVSGTENKADVGQS